MAAWNHPLSYLSNAWSRVWSRSTPFFIPYRVAVPRLDCSTKAFFMLRFFIPWLSSPKNFCEKCEKLCTLISSNVWVSANCELNALLWNSSFDFSFWFSSSVSIDPYTRGARCLQFRSVSLTFMFLAIARVYGFLCSLHTVFTYTLFQLHNKLPNWCVSVLFLLLPYFFFFLRTSLFLSGTLALSVFAVFVYACFLSEWNGGILLGFVATKAIIFAINIFSLDFYCAPRHMYKHPSTYIDKAIRIHNIHKKIRLSKLKNFEIV